MNRLDLPSYSGPDAVCTACGYEHVTTVWKEHGYSLVFGSLKTVMDRGARLVRECQRCTYSWYERTLEADKTIEKLLKEKNACSSELTQPTGTQPTPTLGADD